MTTSDVNKALRAFLMALCTDVSDIIKGYPNAGSLPKKKNYIVFSTKKAIPKSVGTDFFTTDPDSTSPGVWTTAELNFVTYRVDIYGPNSDTNLDCVKAAFRSGLAAEFFSQYRDSLGGIGIVGITNAANATQPDGTSEYAAAQSIELTVAVRFTASMAQEWTDRLTISLHGKV